MNPTAVTFPPDLTPLIMQLLGYAFWVGMITFTIGLGWAAVRFFGANDDDAPGLQDCGVSRFLDSLVMRPGSHVLFVVPMLVLGFGIPARSGDGSGCRRLRCTQRLYGGQGLD